ncbi:hypothetical protein I4U23_031295 [Adineta vaga]|nr:hypothetical protein I4U23_031295 [Adineta vaga]
MDDITIEDEFDSDEQILSQSEEKTNFLLVNYQWIIVFSFFVLVVIYFLKRRTPRRENRISRDETINRYEQMEQIRERQQKQYEQESLRRLEEKQKKIEASKTMNDKPLKYRSNDHNPLTGQSNNSKNDSCSWRPSSRRRPQGG